MNSFSDQALIDVRPSVTEVAKYPRNPHRCNSWSSNAVFDWPTNALQITPNDIFTPYALVTAPDSTGICGSELVWSGEQLARASATSASNYWQNDADILCTTFLDRLLPSNTTANLAQPYTPHSVSARAGVTAVGEHPVSYPVQRHHSVPKPIRGLADKHISGSRIRSTATSSRRTPYPLSRDNAKGDSLIATCQWTTGSIPCGETVVGTKKAVGQHLQAKHAIRLATDMTICLWGDCGRCMRRESIARHILAVHIQEKVPCTACGSEFARPDSLQRHQRACLTKVRGKNTFEVCEV